MQTKAESTHCLSRRAKKSDGVLCQRVQVRYAIVARERARYSVRQLCRTLEVSVSGFHEYLHRVGRPDPEAALRADLHAIHAGSRRTYGRPRMVKALRANRWTRPNRLFVSR